MRTQEQRIKDCSRFIRLFGHRELEVAAMRINDVQWEFPFRSVDISIFDDEMTREGFQELKQLGWVDAQNVPTRAFWMRVHGR